MSSSVSRLAFVTRLVFVFSLTWPGSPDAATLFVTDFGDNGSPGQLRTLINVAAPGDTILIPAGTITLTGPSGEDANLGGDLDILKNLTIQGAGAGATIIDGGALDGVFDILVPHSLFLSGVTIRNGINSAQGGGGGIRNFGTLNLSNVIVSGNQAARTTAGDRNNGGGIRNLGAMSLSRVVISDNVARGNGGGIYNEQGAVMTLADVSVSANRAEIAGGGVFNGGSVTLTRVTVSGNNADTNGGGIFATRGSGVVTAAHTTLTNVTLSGNRTGGLGGGIFNSATAALTNVTVSGNSTTIVAAGGISNSGSATLKNVLLAGNTAGIGGGANCSGTIASLGHNLDDGATCGLAEPGDLSNTDPNLGPLQDSGSFTFTHALLRGSPAIDAGTNAGCPPTDQRGVARPQGAACDIGAYESASSSTLILSLNQTILHSGSALHVGLTAENPMPVFNADFYFGFLLPDGVTICFMTSLSPLVGQCLPLSASPRTFPSLAANFQVPQGLNLRLPDLLVFTFGGGEPQGTYFAFAVLTPAGAFGDGSIDPADIIASSVQALTFGP